jgi:beta-fructofuranosidase
MFFTARVSEQRQTNDAGCIGFATSPDLYSWELQPPVFIGGWGELEVPQVFELEGNWYCLFSMSSKYQAEWNIAKNGKSGRGSHYLMADNPCGPWHLPPGPALDTKINRYSARIVNWDGLKILGFKDGEEINKFGGFIMDPDPVRINANKTLTLEII